MGCSGHYRLLSCVILKLFGSGRAGLIRQGYSHGEPKPKPQPNPPTWPDSVHIFRPEDTVSHIQETVRNAYLVNGGHKTPFHGQFSAKRFAFLFKPGIYHVEVPVGYYTQVLGVGEHPHDVMFDSPRGVFCEAGNKDSLVGSLSNFWRGAENFHTRGNMLWSVSQSAPLRRLIIDGHLALSEYVPGVGMGFSSGGFLSNTVVAGGVQAGSQQQFFFRNVAVNGHVKDGVWNMLFVGTGGAPESHCGRGFGKPGTVRVDKTPVIAEKPFITIDCKGRHHLNIPETKWRSVGPDFSRGRVVDFKHVYVALPSDSAAVINARLHEGLHVVLSPGVYVLEAPLEVVHNGQVLLGIGLATLVAAHGRGAIRVGNVDGAHVGGVLLEAGPAETDVLLDWGDGRYEGDPANPSFLHDVFVRVGGPNDPAVEQARARIMLRLAAGHVVGDHMWMWRADHGVAGAVKHGENPSDTGLVVRGNNVTLYGVSVEHALKDQVQWLGENGETYFFEAELPYDVSSDWGHAGYVGYRVNEAVQSHRAYGVGVYHYFRDHEVAVKSGISAPPWLENSFQFPLSVYLGGRGKMAHVLNRRGGRTGSGDSQVHWVCGFAPDLPALRGMISQPSPSPSTTKSLETTSLLLPSTTDTSQTVTLTSRTESETTTTSTRTRTVTRTSTTLAPIPTTTTRISSIASVTRATTTTITITTTTTSTTTTTTAGLLTSVMVAADFLAQPASQYASSLMFAISCIVCVPTAYACGLRHRRLEDLEQGKLVQGRKVPPLNLAAREKLQWWMQGHSCSPHTPQPTVRAVSVSISHDEHSCSLLSSSWSEWPHQADDIGGHRTRTPSELLISEIERVEEPNSQPQSPEQPERLRGGEAPGEAAGSACCCSIL